MLQISVCVVLFPFYIVSTICFGMFPHYGLACGNSNPSQWRVSSSSLLHAPSNATTLTNLPDGTGCWYTAPCSWEVTSTSLGTEIKCKVSANFIHGTWRSNTFQCCSECCATHNSVYIYLPVAVSGALTAINAHKYLAVMNCQKCQSQEVKSYTHDSLYILFHFH